tara:strand:- start:20823 stop:21803 length:981 start_codon:yes stop_codon:yes gene_type:complete
MKIILYSLLFIFLTNTSISGVVDRKVATPQISTNKADIKNTPANLQPLKVDLKAVQKKFYSSKTTENIKTVYHNKDEISKIKLRVGMRSLLQLDKVETISSYIVGNSKIFKVQGIPSKSHDGGILPNILTIKALYPGADTNLTVLTESGRVYTFYLRSIPISSWESPDITIYVKLFSDDIYPAREQFIKNIGEVEEKITPNFNSANAKSNNDYLNTIETASKPNTHYKIYGDKAIAPYAVYDDGAFTYFDFRHNLTSDRLPVVYKVVDGFDTITNFRMEKGFLIAESLSPEGWTLRNGNKTACIKATLDINKAHPKPPRTQYDGGF